MRQGFGPILGRVVAIVAGLLAGVKHALTKVIFSKLYLDMRDVTVVSAHDLTDGLGDLIAAEERSRTFYRRSDSLSWDEQEQDSNRPVLSDGPALGDLTATDLLAW